MVLNQTLQLARRVRSLTVCARKKEPTSKQASRLAVVSSMIWRMAPPRPHRPADFRLTELRSMALMVRVVSGDRQERCI